jgi:hypothetical protein
VHVIDSALNEDHMIVSETGTAHFSCSTTFNRSVWWKVRTVLHEEQDRRFIYRLRGFVGMFARDRRLAVDYQDGIHRLTIFNTTVTDAGEYQCIEDEGLGPASNAVLNVYGKMPGMHVVMYISFTSSLISSYILLLYFVVDFGLGSSST